MRESQFPRKNVGHVQKRLGSRLRTLKKKNGENTHEGWKTNWGTNRLTDETMNKMQCYFGQTIRDNTDSIYLMKKGYGQYSGIVQKKIKMHQVLVISFAQGDDTWCRYWKAANSGTLQNYVEKPIFVDLSKDDLLLKRVHGLTQNNNESTNKVIRKRVPKDIHVGWEALEMGVASAVINYNNGLNGLSDVYNELSMEVGSYTSRS